MKLSDIYITLDDGQELLYLEDIDKNHYSQMEKIKNTSIFRVDNILYPLHRIVKLEIRDK